MLQVFLHRVSHRGVMNTLLKMMRSVNIVVSEVYTLSCRIHTNHWKMKNAAWSVGSCGSLTAHFDQDTQLAERATVRISKRENFHSASSSQSHVSCKTLVKAMQRRIVEAVWADNHVRTCLSILDQSWMFLTGVNCDVLEANIESDGQFDRAHSIRFYWVILSYVLTRNEGALSQLFRERMGWLICMYTRPWQGHECDQILVVPNDLHRNQYLALPITSIKVVAIDVR